jgi:hypothetical protein
MALTDSLKILLIDTAKSLQGSARHLFMARTVTALGPGGPQRAARELRWGRMTRRKGRRARTRGVHCLDACSLRGRKPAAEQLPHRLSDRRAIVDSHSQAAPQCRSQRLSTRLTAAEVRRQLLAQKGSVEATLPTAATLGTPLHALGDSPPKGAKSQPQKNARQPTPSAPRELGSIGRPMRRTPCDASRWMPKRPATSVRLRGVARAVCRPWPPTMTVTQTRPCPQWASSCQPAMHCFGMGSPPK